MPSIFPLKTSNTSQIKATIDNKTKPLGALGALETLALQLALITKQRQLNTIEQRTSPLEVNDKISLNKPSMLIFAGDHGINVEGLSIAPSEVTKQMVLNFLHGGAAINCFCQNNDIALTVVDCGILNAVTADEMPQFNSAKVSEVTIKASNEVKLIEQRLGAGTNNFATEPAMTLAQVQQGFSQAKTLVNNQISQGVELILLGEMGIANTSSAAAIMAALTSATVVECVGRGTGITDQQLAKKVALIEQALQRLALTSNGDNVDFNNVNSSNVNSSNVNSNNTQKLQFTEADILNILAELGGFEIVQMVAAILTSAAENVPIVIDGFIVSVAALVALRLDKNVANYLVFAHVSQEQAHQLLLQELLAAQTFTEQLSEKQNIQPLLNLGLRLGEGTGGALALPLITAAASFYNNMASFESAGVTV
ncbi:nicotinate-nucleotide--dimethylbenzimidazole phosphoribosyltransferase [Colwellia echini]|uniref:Nicotinate-nucleotide--dimethylbenzimidazole phosphoribosyltransferase n=1 Tax=Colwellia echini TaxID=1982103 RepID=A0ABY3MYQ7_9GAMM|nr:nicotinate-nucleotide--dimethylbenzimidazole phosphoribosyltransferase [Colwellia echini]TYK66366.1 nicotinate-nucleotide--dimethylbenzimidazole phosphoribosyltransferase [Colwellia echini]